MGTSEVEVGFFHACYPEGVQDKVYRLQVLHRGRHELIAVRVDVDDRRTLRLAPLARNWLSKLSGMPLLAALASGDNTDLEAQLNRLFSGGIRPELSLPFYLPAEIERTMMHCALRFDGYKWLEEDAPTRERVILASANEGLINKLTMPPDAEVSFAAFFFLQRFLGKWGGEMLSLNDRHHTAYRYLFLHLHCFPTPARWSSPEYDQKWIQIPRERIATHTAAVRRVLLAPVLREEFS